MCIVEIDSSISTEYFQAASWGFGVVKHFRIISRSLTDWANVRLLRDASLLKHFRENNLWKRERSHEDRKDKPHWSGKAEGRWSTPKVLGSNLTNTSGNFERDKNPPLKIHNAEFDQCDDNQKADKPWPTSFLFFLRT